MLNRKLLDFIVCPKCKGDLTLEEEFLICKQCSVKYPIKDDIPILLVEEAIPININKEVKS